MAIILHLRHLEGENCKCGRTTPILHNLSRKEEQKIKAEGGRACLVVNENREASQAVETAFLP